MGECAPCAPLVGGGYCGPCDGNASVVPYYEPTVVDVRYAAEADEYLLCGVAEAVEHGEMTPYTGEAGVDPCVGVAGEGEPYTTCVGKCAGDKVMAYGDGGTVECYSLRGACDVPRTVC